MDYFKQKQQYDITRNEVYLQKKISTYFKHN